MQTLLAPPEFVFETGYLAMIRPTAQEAKIPGRQYLMPLLQRPVEWIKLI